MKIAIIGTGKMGSWLAKELARDNEILLYDRNRKKADGVGIGRVLAGLDELKTSAPDLLINAVSLENTISVFQEIEKHLDKKCMICDVASIKGELLEYYQRCKHKFVSVHPMFGPTFANVEALSNENMAIIKESDQEGAKFFEDLAKKLEINIFHYTFKEHDEMMAYSLTLPFASTMVFAACMDAKAVPGTTFKKHRLLAKGLLSEEDNLLAEILFNKYSLTQLEHVTARLEFLKHVIKARDYEEAKKFFNKLRENIG
ncbi:MAG: prephenate dehydrogenase/arogenate dehydrogenase family protein [Candidatus Micrarchaeota archaeon]